MIQYLAQLNFDKVYFLLGNSLAISGHISKQKQPLGD